MGTQFSCGLQAGDHLLLLSIDFDTKIAGQESCCGSDAFYRDAFLEHVEHAEPERYRTPSGSLTEVSRDRSPGPRKQSLTAKAMEQVKLKATKGKVFAQHAVTSAKAELREFPETVKAVVQRKSSSLGRGSFSMDMKDEPLVIPGMRKVSHQVLCDGTQTLMEWMKTSSWVGKTIPEWCKDSLQSPKDGPCWKKGDGIGLPVRSGPNYRRRREMTKTQSHMYNNLTLDGIRSSQIFEDIIGRVVGKVPPPSRGCEWTPDCPLPRVLCINVKLPFYNPKNPFAKEDGGCSFVAFFEISNETISSLKAENGPPPCVRLFQEFCEGPTGTPGCSGDPNRSLSLRRKNSSETKDCDSGIFKAAGWCENEDELKVPMFLRQFNGKSFVITDSGYVVKDPKGEWLELGFDVRRFPILFKDALYTFRHFLPKAQYHCGFMIQATDDKDLPEGLLCDLYLSGVNIQEHTCSVPDCINGKAR